MELHIVSTKILEEGLVRQLEDHGLKITLSNFIRKTIQIPENITSISINPVIVLTSKTAVEAWMEILKVLPKEALKFSVYCLEFATQAKAHEFGLNIAGVAKDASSLATLIPNDKAISAVTFICGNLRRDELPNALKSQGVHVQEIEGYRTAPTSIKIEKPYHGVLFFSPSAIDSFLSLNGIGSSVAFCLGKTTADHARIVGFSEVQIAASHRPESLVQTVINFYKLPVHAQK